MDTKRYEQSRARRLLNANATSNNLGDAGVSAVDDGDYYVRVGALRGEGIKKPQKPKKLDSRATAMPQVRQRQITGKTSDRTPTKMRNSAGNLNCAYADATSRGEDPKASCPVLQPSPRLSPDLSGSGLFSLPLELHDVMFTHMANDEPGSDFLKAIYRCRSVSRAFRGVVDELIALPHYWDIRELRFLNSERFASPDEKRSRSARQITQLEKSRSPFQTLGALIKKEQALGKNSFISLNFAKIPASQWKSAIEQASRLKNCSVLHLDASRLFLGEKVPIRKLLSYVGKMRHVRKLPLQICLDLGHCVRNEKDVQALASALKRNPHIVELTMSTPTLHEPLCEILVAAISGSKVPSLVLSDSVSDGPMAVLASAFVSANSLNSITLNGAFIKEKGMAAIADGLRKSQSLATLKLRVNLDRPEDITTLAKAVAANTSLRELELSGGVMGLDTLKELEDALKQNRTLELLVLKDCKSDGAQITPECHAAIKRLRHDPRVRMVGELAVRNEEGMLGNGYYVPSDSDDARQHREFQQLLAQNSSFLG